MITLNEETEDKAEKAFVIAGINGDIGREFATRLQDYGKVFGISRKKDRLDGIIYEHIACDLLQPKLVQEMFSQLGPFKDMTYIHLPGRFQFQDENHPIKDRNGDGIDDDIFRTNVETFRNVIPYLFNDLLACPTTTLKLVAIGSASDLYAIPYWHSFTHSKNELRRDFRAMYGNPSTYGRVGSLFINVSTTEGRQLSGERPYISKQYLLTPKEIVDQSMPYMLDKKPACVEVTILKPNPDFEKEDFLKPEEIRKRWYRDMYG
ncbi:hypothetical protein C4573_03675 [Candidatus Woesearchaeota archaeon]|nr:MAG: hypothetical protein C4573_03675 [Candidatus Woesearchaeota archaeon]